MGCLCNENCLKTDESNLIWFNNKAVTGEQYYFVFFTSILISFPYILFLIIIILEKNNLPIIFPLTISSILYIIEIYSLIKCCFSDPGILHKQERDFRYRPRKYYIKKIVNGHLYEINYCNSCLLFKPPRASHCQLCDNCVLRFDHHCKWIGQCIGQKNYRYFYVLVFDLFFDTLFYIVYSLYYVIFQSKKAKNKENYNKVILWGLSVIALYNIIIIKGFVAKLFIIHNYLQFINKTFYEYFKKKFSYIPGMNPFKKYSLYICKRLVLKSPGKSFYLYFVKHPEKLKLMTLDEESYRKIENNYNRIKLSNILKNLPIIISDKKYEIEKQNEQNKINDINIGIKCEEDKNNNTKEEGDIEFKSSRIIDLKFSKSSSRKNIKIK